MKLKTLPSLREKKRYVIFKIHSQERVSFFETNNAIWNSILNWLGEKETAKANPWIIKNLWDQRKQIGFIKCSHKYVDDIKTALSLIHQIGDEKVTIQTLIVSGTIKSGKKKLNSLF